MWMALQETGTHLFQIGLGRGPQQTHSSDGKKKSWYEIVCRDFRTNYKVKNLKKKINSGLKNRDIWVKIIKIDEIRSTKR